MPLINGIARGGEGAGSRQHVEEHKIQKRPPKGEKAFLEKVIRQIIWKIVSFFGTFFKVQYLLIGNDL